VEELAWGARPFATRNARVSSLSKTEAWNLYWTVNTFKVQLLLLRYVNSLNKFEREMFRRIEEAWAE